MSTLKRQGLCKLHFLVLTLTNRLHELNWQGKNTTLVDKEYSSDILEVLFILMQCNIIWSLKFWFASYNFETAKPILYEYVLKLQGRPRSCLIHEMEPYLKCNRYFLLKYTTYHMLFWNISLLTIELHHPPKQTTGISDKIFDQRCHCQKCNFSS